MNEQKSFIAILALVVAAGLVLGTLAFSAGGRNAGTAAASPTENSSGNATAPASSIAASDPQPSSVEEPVGVIPPSIQDGDAPAGGEPGKTVNDAPPMQGPGNGDPPGTALGSEPSGDPLPPSDTPQ
jgi:hypothetical protein